MVPFAYVGVNGGRQFHLPDTIGSFAVLQHPSVQCEDLQVRKKYEAVGRFFRAWFYFLRVRTYGDVPWFDHVVGSADKDELYKDRDDRGYVMDKVLEDIRFAADNLPSSWERNNTRVTKWAALALGTRAALYEGTFRKYHEDLGLTDADKYLRIAAEMGKEFIDESPFSLYNEGTQPYRDLFWQKEPKTHEPLSYGRRYPFPG